MLFKEAVRTAVIGGFYIKKISLFKNMIHGGILK